MEKTQHNSSKENTKQERHHEFVQSQPGQQLPATENNEEARQSNASEKNERHSASSFPQQEGETLGTP